MKVNKETKQLLCYFGIAILTVAFLISATSCASRKVNRQEEKQKIDFKEETKETVKTDTQINTVTIDTSTIDEIEVIPIDNTKPIVVNGKTYVNAKIKHVKRKNNISVNQVEKVAKNESKVDKTSVKAKVEVKQKQTDKESIYSWWWLLLVIGALIIIYRKYLRW